MNLRNNDYTPTFFKFVVMAFALCLALVAFYDLTLNVLTCTVHLTPCDGIKNMAAIALQFKSNVNLIAAMFCNW